MVFRGYICTIYYLDDLIIHTRREGTTTDGEKRTERRGEETRERLTRLLFYLY
jgi:hypothetical protein